MYVKCDHTIEITIIQQLTMTVPYEKTGFVYLKKK